jgi:hypothetical protein
MEIESALVAHPRVAEAAVVGRPHEIKGESVFAYVVLRGPRPSGDSSALQKELRDFVGKELGPIAKPDDIRFADNLPKTRSGKIMRRLLKAIARGEEITQDVSTLENPAILDQLRGTEGTAGAAPKAMKPKKAKTKRTTAKKGRVQASGKGSRRPSARKGVRRASSPGAKRARGRSTGRRRR